MPTDVVRLLLCSLYIEVEVLKEGDEEEGAEKEEGGKTCN
jgi:hypothetical protein